MTPEEYKKNVDALAFALLEKHKNLYEEAGFHWAHVTSGYYDFEQNVRDADAVSDKNSCLLGKNFHVLENQATDVQTCAYLPHIQLMKQVKHVTKESLIEFFDKFINPSSPTLRKVSVHVRSLKTHLPTAPAPTSESTTSATSTDNTTDSSTTTTTTTAAITPATASTNIFYDDEKIKHFTEKGNTIIRTEDVPALKMRLQLGPSCWPVQAVSEYFSKNVSLVGQSGSKL
jgi:hypothetical protein